MEMTVDVYGYLIPGFNKQAVDKLDDPRSETVAADPKNNPKYVQINCSR